MFGATPWVGESQIWTPLADVSETDDAYLVEVDLPGVKRDDIDVEVTGNELVVTGEFKERERDRLAAQPDPAGRPVQYRTMLPQDVNSEQIARSCPTAC